MTPAFPNYYQNMNWPKALCLATLVPTRKQSLMDFKAQHILSAAQFDKARIQRVLEVARTMESFACKKKSSKMMEGKVLATLFFEPSTRTRFSFETAMLR